MQADLPARAFELTALHLAANLPHPRGGALPLQTSGSARVALVERKVQARLNGQFDGNALDARLAMTALAPAVWQAALDIDKLDLDRYLLLADAAPPAGSAKRVGPVIDLSALQGLDGNATLRVGALRVAKLELAELRASFCARSGRLDVDPVNASLYQSRLAGSLSAVHGALPQLAPKQRLDGSGAVDLGAGRIDMLIKATVAGTLQGQGGPELQALRGATLPVRLAGPFDAVGVQVDLAAAVQDLARDKFDDAARDLKEQPREKLGDALKGLFGK